MPKLAQTFFFFLIFYGVFDTSEAVFFSPKMLKSAPKWLKLMPEIRF
jgi:hypothetical protein